MTGLFLKNRFQSSKMRSTVCLIVQSHGNCTVCQCQLNQNKDMVQNYGIMRKDFITDKSQGGELPSLNGKENHAVLRFLWRSSAHFLCHIWIPSHFKAQNGFTLMSGIKGMFFDRHRYLCVLRKDSSTEYALDWEELAGNPGGRLLQGECRFAEPF